VSFEHDGGGFFGWLRGLFGGGRQTLPDGRQIVSRVEAAKVCAHALLHSGIGAAPASPLGDAGRVTVSLFVVRSRQPIQLGWIEIPLSGELRLHLDDSALAAQYAGHVGEVIAAAFQKLAVRPVPADGRTWTIGARRVAQAAVGTWMVIAPDGAVLASVDTPEEAVRVAQSEPEVATSAPAGGDGVPAATAAAAAIAGELRVEMEHPHAARWIAKMLREHGYEARAENDTITLGLQGFAARIGVSIDGPTFDDAVPKLARAVVDGALRRVQLVEHLE
jgi:hypothetical protein